MSNRLRSDELQLAAIQRLGAALDVDAENVIRTAVAADRDDLDPRVTVGATVDSTTPHNAREHAEATVRVAVDGTKDYVLEAAGDPDTPRLKTILADAVDELTAHRDGLTATGVQAEEDIAFNEELNRHLGAVEVGIEQTTARRAAQVDE